MIIMTLSYNVSLRVPIFSLRKCFFQPHDVTFSGHLGASPLDPHRGSAPGSRWGTSIPHPQTPCQCPSQTKILDPPCSHY